MDFRVGLHPVLGRGINPAAVGEEVTEDQVIGQAELSFKRLSSDEVDVVGTQQGGGSMGRRRAGGIRVMRGRGG